MDAPAKTTTRCSVVGCDDDVSVSDGFRDSSLWSRGEKSSHASLSFSDADEEEGAKNFVPTNEPMMESRIVSIPACFQGYPCECAATTSNQIE